MTQGTGGGEYEFNEPQNGVIGELAGAVTFVGTLLLISGVFQVVAGIIALVGGHFGQGGGAIVQGILNIMLGNWTRGAGAAFDNIVKTQGNDIQNLMTALGELKQVYRVQRILIIIGMVIALMAVAGSFVAAALLAVKGR